jgi:dolichol-phosphate mannosyltransferase
MPDDATLLSVSTRQLLMTDVQRPARLAKSSGPQLADQAGPRRADQMSVEPHAASSSRDVAELTVVVPTFNEAKNVPILVERLHAALLDTSWEASFVDDNSPDATARVARDIARRDRRVRVIRRVGRRGLSSACVEGVLASAAPYFAVMDGDLQHDEKLLGEMLRVLKAKQVDIVIGSRYKDGERTEGLAPWRKWVSRAGGRVARLVLKADLTDPMSGFFLMTRDAFDACVPALSQQGFKILLDIFASSPTPLRFVELPCQFNPRQHGQSKLDTMAAWDFGVLVLDKLIGRFVPTRFVIFAGVGATGVVVHLATLGLMAEAGFRFEPAQATAVVAAMAWNFVLDNTITYRDQRLRGFAFWRGLATFFVIGSIGAVANIGISGMLFGQGSSWWLAGTAGALIGVVWNFTMSSLFTWRVRAP